MKILIMETKIQCLPKDILANILGKLVLVPSSLGEILEVISPLLQVYGGNLDEILRNPSIWYVIAKLIGVSISSKPSPPLSISKYNGLLEIRSFTDLDREFTCWRGYRITTDATTDIMTFIDNNHQKIVMDLKYYEDITVSEKYFATYSEFEGGLEVKIWEELPWTTDRIIYYYSNKYNFVGFQETAEGTLIHIADQEENEYLNIDEKSERFKSPKYIQKPNFIGYYGDYMVSEDRSLLSKINGEIKPVLNNLHGLKLFESCRGVDIFENKENNTYYVYDAMKGELLWSFKGVYPKVFWNFIYCYDWIRDLKTGIILFDPSDYGDATAIRGITAKDDQSGFFVWIYKKELRENIISEIERSYFI